MKSIDKFIEQKGFHCFEGDRGVEKLNEITKALGYRSHDYRYGSSLEVFLSDNSGCIEAMINWIREREVEWWNENLKNELVEEEVEEEIEE